MALKNTKGLQDALTWLESHQDTPFEELVTKFATSSSAPAQAETGGPDESQKAAEEAKSYKCNDCGKLLRNWDAVQFHAERTEHQNFDESTEEVKPLTEEEKKQKLEELKLRLAEKRKAQAAESTMDAKKNEAIRRKRDQESEKMKEELRKKEQLRDIERRKQEKIEDARARARIKEEIAATQQARRDAAAKAKAQREGMLASEPSGSASTSSSAGKPPVSHAEARLRFQIPGRPPVTKVFPSDATLFEVASSLAQETGTAINSFTTTFPPRKTYQLTEPLDSSKTLKEANLTPSASLLVA
ncbi:hypothetical protein ABW19_dt0210087 [Dactylella cylindrospora]|nr:hypothetical protein ABW19_dt0210087 [Dactylella cylindrospora]